MTLPSNVLPHNPLTTAGVLDELKTLKGEKPWILFELELLCKQYPNNTKFKEALEKLAANTTQAQTKAEPSKAKAAKKPEKK